MITSLTTGTPTKNQKQVSSGETSERAIQLRLNGKTLREIATELKISPEWARVLTVGIERGYREPKQKLESLKSEDDPALEVLRRDFSIHCKRLRKKLKVTQAEFGSRLGLGEAAAVTISRWESAKTTPQKRYLLRFLEFQKQFDAKRVKKNGH